MQSYAGDPVQAYAPDMWNGSVAQCNSFITATGISYPVLRLAGNAGLGASYAISWDVSFVVDGDGVIVYRANGFNQSAVKAAIDGALADLVTAVGDVPAGRSFTLDPAYPNPFNPSTTIAWSIDASLTDATVQVEIHDLRGRRVAALLDTRLAGGQSHSVLWDGRSSAGNSVESGTYLAVVRVNGIQKARFLTLVK